MSEHQHAEWKRSWRDEFLKWICGFANADGGVLVIGKDDKGKLVGLSNAEKLLKEIPNKFPFTPQEGKETPVETREKTREKILRLIAENPAISMEDMATCIVSPDF